MGKYHEFNPMLQQGRPVHFNINVEEDLPALLTSLQLFGQISDKVRQRIQQNIQRQNQLLNYLGLVKAAGETAALVQLINNARRNEYQKLATANSLQLADVEILAGQKALNKTQSGRYILQDGKWLKT